MANTSNTTKSSYFGPEGMGGGLVSENAITLKKNQMVEANNVLVGTTISRRKRGGQAKWHTGTFDTTASYPASGVAIRGIKQFWRTASLSGSPTNDLFLHQSTKVWSIHDRNTVGVDRTGALTINASGVPCYQPFNQKLYFCSSITSDGYNKWDGAASTAVVASAPSDGAGKFLCSHFGRMVMTGNNNFPYTVYLSTTFNPENWSSVAPNDSTSFQLDDDGDPQGITGARSFQGRLYVWTRYSVYEVLGNTPSTFVVNRISNGIGCISNNSIVNIPNDVIFASDRGVHSLRQIQDGRITQSTFLSRDIQRLWTELLNPAFYTRISAVYDDTINCYVITVPSSGQSALDQILVYNIEFGLWTVWPNMNARSMDIALVSNTKNIIAGKEDGVIALINQPDRNDFGSGYTANFKTGILYIGDPTVERYFKSITVYASTTLPSNFSVSWNIDGKKEGSKVITLGSGTDVLGSTFVLGTSVLGIGQNLPNTCSIDDVGYGIQIEIISDGLNDIEFYGFIIETGDLNENYT